MAPRRMLLLAAGTVAGLLVALLLVPRSPGGRAGEADAATAYRLPAPLPAADFELTDHTGRPVRLSALGRDRVLALFFGYTHCPDVCPLTLANLVRVRGLLGADSARVRAALVTVDPERDSVPRLAEYVGGFPGVIGLTGPRDTLAAAARAYMAYAERAAPQPAHEHDEPVETRPEFYLVDHTTRTLIVRDGRIVMTVPAETTPPQMAEALRVLLQR